MATQLPLPELDEEEQLFYSVIHCPVQECDSLLKSVGGVDIRNGCGRTLLHVSVRLGRLEWVRKLLSMGSDPSSMDRRGDTVLAVAEEMCKKYPAEADRRDILEVVRLVYERDLFGCRAKGEGSSSLRPGALEQLQGDGLTTLLQVLTTVPTLTKEMRDLKECVRGELGGIALQMGSISRSLQAMPRWQSGDSEAKVNPLLPSILQSLGREHCSVFEDQLGVTSQSPVPPSSVTIVENETSNDFTNLLQSGGTENSSGNVIGSDASQNLVASASFTLDNQDDNNDVSAEVSAVASQVAVASVSSTVIVGGESQGDPPLTEVGNCQPVQGDVVEGIVSGKQISELKEAIDDIRTMFASRDILLRALEVSVTSMAEEFGYVKGHLEEIGEKVSGVSEGLETLKNSSSRYVQSLFPLVEKRRSEACIEAMMKKTDILNGDESKVFEIRGYYAHLCSTSLLAPLLSFVASQPQVRVMIDCRSQYIGGMRERFVDHDGIVREGAGFYSFADFDKRWVYLGGKTSESRKRETVMGWLARSLAQMALCLAFNNRGRPYAEGDTEARARYLRIVKEAKEVEYRGIVLETYLRWVGDWDVLMMREVKLISTVPLMVAEYGSTDAEVRLQRQLPELWDYYTEHVLGAMTREIEASQSIASSVESCEC